MHSLRYVAESLDKLEHAVDASDNAPSPDARAGVTRIKPLTDSTLAAWTAWQEKDLPVLNAKLKSAGHDPLVLKPD